MEVKEAVCAVFTVIARASFSETKSHSILTLSPLISPLSPISLTLFLSTSVSIYLQVLCVHFKRRAIRPSISLIIHS